MNAERQEMFHVKHLLLFPFYKAKRRLPQSDIRSLSLLLHSFSVLSYLCQNLYSRGRSVSKQSFAACAAQPHFLKNDTYPKFIRR